MVAVSGSVGLVIGAIASRCRSFLMVIFDRGGAGIGSLARVRIHFVRYWALLHGGVAGCGQRRLLTILGGVGLE